MFKLVSLFFNDKTKIMEKYEWFMGIDVSKGKLDITLLKGSEKALYQVIENSVKSLQVFNKQLNNLNGFDWNKCLVCIEHTGIYNAHLLATAQKYKWQLCLESAVQIKYSGGLQRGKNDTVDSYRIALYAYKNIKFLRLWQPERMILVKLKKLSALRCRLIQAKKQLGTALKEDKSFLDKSITKIIEKCNKHSIDALNADIKVTDKKIEEVIKEDKELKALFDIVESVPGAGPVIALEMITTTNEFKNIQDPRKYACYSGIAPFEHSSGSSTRGKTRTSKKANQYVKSLLHMGSLIVVRTDSDMKKYYERKVDEGKNKMVVLNAVKNKIIHRIFACVSKKKMYEINYKNSLEVS